MVNVQKCLQLAEVVEKSKTFTMNLAYRSCGTPGCIYGHLFPGSGSALMFERGSEVLGITLLQAIDLFTPTTRTANWRAHPHERDYITNEHAAACLRKLATDKIVDWEGTKPKE